MKNTKPWVWVWRKGLGCEGGTEKTQKQTKGTQRKIRRSSRNQEARRNLKLISEGTEKGPWPQMELEV